MPAPWREPQRRSRAEVPNRTLELRFLLATLLFVALSPALNGQDQPEPKPLRFDVTPFAGYRTSISFPLQPQVTGSNPRVIIDQNPSYGVSFGVRLRDELDLVEIRWARQDSHVHSENVAPQIPRQHVTLDQFHGDFSHEWILEEWPAWARPFALASVGATYVSSSNNISFTRFSFGIGGGVRFYASRHFGFKVQAEWVPVFMDPNVAFVCGGGCIVHVGGTLSSQGEVFAGPVLRF